MNNKHKKPTASEYASQLQEYLHTVDNLKIDSQIDARRLEHHFECFRDWSLFHDEESVKKWFLQKRHECTMQLEDIPLNQTKDWLIDPDTGNVQHISGEFFSVHGLRITQSGDREVGQQGWDQPIVTQTGFDGGLLGILSKRFEGIPHYLIEAKAEPGNYGKLQLSPTLQATFSNLKMAHKGRKPHFSHFFEDANTNDATVLYQQWLSEDGGRFYLKRNMAMLIEISEKLELDIPQSFIWLSMYQIKSLLHENAWINPHIRGIIAHL